jgi:hypothetical protein
MTYEYREIPGGSHPDPIRIGAQWVFSFFDQHTRKPIPTRYAAPISEAACARSTVATPERSPSRVTAALTYIRRSHHRQSTEKTPILS